MAVRYKGCRVDWLLSKLYNLLLGYLRDEHFFFLFTRGNAYWKKPIYPLIVIGFSFSFNQLWYLRVSNSPEAGATSLLCHLLVIHPYGKRILCRGSDTVSHRVFCDLEYGTNGCRRCSNAKNDSLFLFAWSKVYIPTLPNDLQRFLHQVSRATFLYAYNYNSKSIIHRDGCPWLMCLNRRFWCCGEFYTALLRLLFSL